ncbi:cytochrome P450 CYP82D47-like [Benincasa hispida]|uniref:cytochrome P450 CYP82D47-like n=1 Tax=Benincasa hispida TaxID=102211 RepID=UPI0018FF19B9|nr:cytochrome P450 CYP82D47-like [Benincasa hispida]
MEEPHVLTVIIFAGLLFFFYVIFTMCRRYVVPHRKRLPPEAGGAWPVIGHLHLLNASEPIHITLAKMADAYGPIFTFRFGMKKTLIVSNWEIAKELFTTNDRIFASRPKLLASKLLAYDYAMIGFSLYNPHWRYVRKIATLGLLTNHRVEQLEHIRAVEVQTWMKELHELYWLKNNKKSEKVVVDMKKWFQDITLNTIFKMVIGKRFTTAFDDDEASKKCRKALRDFSELFGKFIPSDWFPFVSWLDFGGHGEEMMKTAQILDETFHNFLQQHRKKRDYSKGNMDQEQDFMDLMISTVEDDEGEPLSYDVDTIIKAICVNVILGGFDTTSIVMTWALSLLLNNKETLRKVQVELDEQIGRERQVKESDIKNLSYLQAIVKETLRLHPAAPLLLPHESLEDCTTAGYHIPKGTRLIVNVQKLQKDPCFWEDPCEFRPERFLTSHKNIDVRGHNAQLIPFGNGRRKCPAISLALQIIYLTLANFLHGFKTDRLSEELFDMEESGGLTSARKTPLEVVLTPRLATSIY